MSKLMKLAVLSLVAVLVNLPLTSAAHARQAGESRPGSHTYATTGLWKVLTAETLPVRHVSFSTSYERQHRYPGDLQIDTFRAGAAAGITARLEGGIHIEAYRQVRVRAPEQLSFGQQALGFFGNKTPGSPPLPSELMPGSSRVPQLRDPAAPSGALTGRAGYYNLLPFSGLVESAGSVGLVTLSAKYKLSPETGVMPFALAVNSYFGIPIHKGIDYLIAHPVGTADLHFGVDVIASRNIDDVLQFHLNAGVRHISQPAHASVFRLSDELPLSLGVVIPRSGRLQLMVESAAEVFVGSHTPNTTSGPADPVDITAGFRLQINPAMSLTAGYQRPLRSGPPKHGFALSFSYTVPEF